MAQNLGNLFIDGESVIEDENGNHTISTSGGVSLDTSQKRFDNSSILLSSGYLDAGKHEDWYFGSGDFTVDFWVRPTNLSNPIVIINCGGVGGTANASSGWSLCYYNRLYFYSTGPGLNNDSVNGTLTNEAWQHVAVTRSGTTLRMFIDGTNVYTGQNSQNYSTLDDELVIGCTYEKDQRFLPGNIDNIRIVKGTALWTENFDSEDTDVLFYTPIPQQGEPYVRPDTISGLFNIGSRGSLRGKAKAGFIRPTISQFFTTVDFSEILKEAESAGSTITGYTEDRCTGGTPSASSEWSVNYAATYAVDDNPDNSFWNTVTGASNFPHWFKYDFGAGNEKQIQKVVLQQYQERGPGSFKVQGSNNDSDWTDLESFSIYANSWPSNGTKEFIFSNEDSYRYYRLYFMTAYDGDDNEVGLKQVEMMEAEYGILYTEDKATGGTASASSIHSAPYSADKAFDDDENSFWSGGPDGGPSFPVWIMYDFGTGTTKKIAKVRIRPRNGVAGYTPASFDIQGSNNNSDWITLSSQTSQTFTDGEYNEYEFENNTNYRYYRIICYTSNQTHINISEIEMLEVDDYSNDLVPTLHSTTSNVIYSGNAEANYPPYRAFNDSWSVAEQDSWFDYSTAPWYIGYIFDEAKQIQKYAIRNRYSSGHVNSPNTWVFQGSNNGTDWTTLDSQSGITDNTSASRNEYTFTNENSYTHYRLYITVGNGPDFYCGLDELELMEKYR